MAEYDMEHIINDPNAMYEAFESKSLEEQYDFLMEILRQKLPENFGKETEYGDLVLEVIGGLSKQKEMEKAVVFLEQFRQLQPAIYQREFPYFASDIAEYFLFTGEPEKVLPQVELFLAHPTRDIDMMLDFLKKIAYWGREKWAAKLARKTYRPVEQNPDILPSANSALATAILNAGLESALVLFQETGELNIEPVKKDAEEYGYVITPEVWDHITTALKSELDREDILARMTQNKGLFFDVLEIHFQKYMYQRGMSFYTAHILISEIRTFWMERTDDKTRSPDALFRLLPQPFEAYLVRKRYIFEPRMVDILAILWGSSFVYDFLVQQQLISAQTEQQARQTINYLKSVLYKSAGASLWRAGFIHKVWPRPDGISPEEWEAEAVLFEKSFSLVDDTLHSDPQFRKALDVLPKPVKPKKARRSDNPARAAKRKKRKKRKRRR